MNVAFRVDASIDIGVGHVMRCLTLADKLTSQGVICYFVCRNLPGNLFDEIESKGYKLFILKGLSSQSEITFVAEDRIEYSRWLGVDWKTDAEQTLAILKGIPIEWLVVDHYALDYRWENNLITCCNKLMVIDDLADRKHRCDLLLDQTLFRSETLYQELVPETCKIITGAKYALLRQEFHSLREYSLSRRDNNKLGNILISIGGIDKNNTTSHVLDAINQCNLPDGCTITVVMGRNSPWLSDVKSIANNMQFKTIVQVNIQDMASLMAESDLAIGSASTTSWERACLGLPTLLINVADNQKYNAKALVESGAALLLGDTKYFRKNLISVLSNNHIGHLLHGMSKCARDITDGLGVDRVIDVMTHK